MTRTPQQVLDAALSYLEEHGWRQGAAAPWERSCCALQAINRVSSGLECIEAEDALRARLPSGIITWNDAPGRDFNEVRAVMRGERFHDGDDPNCSDCGCCHCPGSCDGEHDCFEAKCECTEQCACCHSFPKEDEWGRKWFTRNPPLCLQCRGEYERDRDEAWAEDMWRRDEEAAGRRPR